MPANGRWDSIRRLKGYVMLAAVCAIWGFLAVTVRKNSSGVYDVWSGTYSPTCPSLR